MKTTLISSLLFIVLFSFSNKALAYLHFEPSLSYTVFGQYDLESQFGGSEDDFSSLELGMRLGYQSPRGFQVGGNVDIGVGKLNTDDIKTVTIDPYLMFGFQADFGLRGFIGFSPTTYLGTNSDFLDANFLGYGFKIGGGYLIQKLVAINLFFKYNDFYDIDSPDTDGFESLPSDFKTHSINLSVSFPFNFMGNKKKHKVERSKEELNDIPVQKTK